MKFFIFSVIFLLFPSYSYSAFHIYNPKGSLDGYIGRIDQKGFRFFVVGDIKSTVGNIERFEDILEEAKSKRPSFIVLLGDFVVKGTEKEYKFFLEEVEESGLLQERIPLFLVLGNHDLDRWDRKPGLFNKYFGTTRYWFSLGNSLFIVVDTGDGVLDEEQLQWIESLLKEKGKHFLHTFLFMHIPPINFDIPQDRKLSRGAREFMAIMEKYGVDRVFCAHYHTYRRQSVNGVTYILTGGGGSKLMDRDSFYHYLEIEVNGPLIEEKVCRLDPSYGVSDVFEYQSCNHFIPWILSHWVCLPISISLSVFIIWRVIIKRSRKNNRSNLRISKNE